MTSFQGHWRTKSQKIHVMPSAAPTAGSDGGKQERTKGYIVVSLSYMKDLATIVGLYVFIKCLNYLLISPWNNFINAKSGRQKQKSQYFRPIISMLTLQQYRRDDFWYFHKILTQWDLAMMTKWLKAEQVERSGKFRKPIYCNVAFKTRKWQHPFHITTQKYPKSKTI